MSVEEILPIIIESARHGLPGDWEWRDGVVRKAIELLADDRDALRAQLKEAAAHLRQLTAPSLPAKYQRAAARAFLAAYTARGGA